VLEADLCFDFDNFFTVNVFYLFHSCIVFVEKFGQQARTWAVVKAGIVSSPVQDHHSQ
jgi:heme/copper-type cytochrome/quinol oxidase subunit 1